jgi:glycosyltransferase involved in cell wall biosynthesis
MNNHATEIAYVLKGFGRTSETFITNEIHLLETLGMRLSLFSLLQLEDQQQHAVLDEIKALVRYLPQLTPLPEANLIYWLRVNLPPFLPAHWRLFRARPGRYLKTFGEMLRFTLRYRESRWSRPRKQFLKEFLQAGFIAEQVLQAGRIRHLHAHFAHTATTVAMFASQLSGVPFSFTGHAKDIYLPALNPGNLLALKLHRAKFVVTCTGANERYLRGVQPHSAPLHTIYHGLDTKRFAPLEQQAQPRPWILSVGRFVEKKGYQYLVEACRILREQECEFECHIVGGGDAGPIKQLIQKWKLEDKVFLHSAVTQEELREIYRRATVFALACQIVDSGDRDGIPNVLAEAMAMELPVVSTDISGIPELVEHRVNGLLVPQKDAAALAAAIAELLNDIALHARLGQAAREKVCRIFDAQVNVQALYHLFQS